MIEWNARFNASSSKQEDDLQIIMLQGVLIDSTVNSNGWQIQDEDLEDIAKQSIGAQLRLDHSADVQKVKGQILEAEIDKPHSEDKGPHDPANENMHIHFKAEVVTDDPTLIIPITRGYVNRVSIGADAKTVFCAQCGKPTRPKKICNCKSHEILKDIIVREYSIVTTPAYESAVFTPFSAAIDKFLEGDTISEEKESTTISDGATVHVTSDTTNINYFNSTHIPSVGTTESNTFVASEKEESEELKKEELKEVEAEVDHKVDPNEAPKDFIVNVNKDEIKDPGVIDKAEDEDDNMDEDMKERDDKIAALTAAVEKLVASLTAVKAEAEDDEDKEKMEAEEDEEEKVEAMDGHPFKEKNVDSGSPPNPTGAEPEVHDAPDKYPVNEKDIKIPKKTPAMGVSAGLISTGKIGIDVETGSVNEIFGFAAKHQI